MSPIPTIKTRPDFLAVRAAGKKWVTRGLILQAGPCRRGANAMRVGYTVSKKVGNAVERNRVRRRLREVVRAVMGAQAAPGYDYVIIGRRAGLMRPFATLTRDLAYALRKMGLAKEPPA